MMKVHTAAGSGLDRETPLLAFGAWEGDALPEALAGMIEASDWSGKYRQLQLVYPRGVVAARRVLLVGLGKREQATADRLRELAAIVVQRALDLKVDSYAVPLPTLDALTPDSVAQAIVEGSALGEYRFDRYKSDVKPEERATIAELTLISASDAAEGARVGAAIARGVIVARDLANRPANDLNPEGIAEAARAIGAQFGMRTMVLGMAELVEQGFGGIVAVGRGSANEPRFITIEHGAPSPNTPTICLVGKGISFDTGGISIKPADSMDLMKMDMGGAAAVLGAMHVAGELNLPLHIVGLIASAENMPSSTAYRPGDIIATLSGKTIEVLNTDAEGRIVLADALHYAQRYNPAAIIDLATLTGAVSVALGSHAIGVMGNDDALAARITRAGDRTGERAWQLPLWEPYRDMVKSDIADVKNSAGRAGAAITAGAFLSNFVGEFPWAHLDIAGTAWTDAKPKAYNPKGATGVGVRLLIDALRNWRTEG
jgi:leucyl aminopeptidase